MDVLNKVVFPVFTWELTGSLFRFGNILKLTEADPPNMLPVNNCTG
jgi:hypothetical protein